MTLEGVPLNTNPTAEEPALPRVFLHEPGWRVGLKHGSERELCYSMAPGQDYYHRLLDGEIYLYHGDEKLCLPCASRRGLMTYEPRPLREPVADVEIAGSPDQPPYEVRPPKG